MKISAFLLLSVLTIGLLGCEDVVPKTPLPTDPVVESAENDLVSYSRTMLTAVESGSVFSVVVSATAKESLELFAVSEVIPQGFSVIEGDTTAFMVNVGPGDAIELNYLIQAGDQSGDFFLVGSARAKPEGDESLKLELMSGINVR
jgi:hypothetical protein